MNKTALLTAAQVHSVIDMGPHVIELFLVPKHPFLTAICDYCKKKKLQYVIISTKYYRMCFYEKWNLRPYIP